MKGGSEILLADVYSEGDPTNVLQDHRLLQATPDGRAIWRATVTSSTGWTHTFTLLRLSPSLIWEPAERPLPFAGTVEEEMSASQANNPGSDAGSVPGSTTCASSSPIPVSIATSTESSKALSTVHDTASITQLEAGDVVGDLMALMGESPGLASSPMEASAIKPSVPANLAVAASTALERCDPPQVPPGECFVSWLGEGINSHRLIINDAKALVHIVDNTVFMVSPGIFQRYVQEYPEIALVAKQEDQQGWQWVQKRFEKMQLHRKQPNGLNVWACLVTGPRKSRRLYGYLLKDTKLLHDTPPNNPHLSLC